MTSAVCLLITPFDQKMSKCVLSATDATPKLNELEVRVDRLEKQWDGDPQ